MTKAKKAKLPLTFPEGSLLKTKTHLECTWHVQGLILEGEIEEYDFQEEGGPDQHGYDIKFRDGGWLSLSVERGQVSILYCNSVAFEFVDGNLRVMPANRLDK